MFLWFWVQIWVVVGVVPLLGAKPLTRWPSNQPHRTFALVSSAPMLLPPMVSVPAGGPPSAPSALGREEQTSEGGAAALDGGPVPGGTGGPGGGVGGGGGGGWGGAGGRRAR